MAADEENVLQLHPSELPVILASINNNPLRFVVYAESGEPIVTIYAEGKLELNPKYTTDEAAQSFWKAVREILESRRC